MTIAQLDEWSNARVAEGFTPVGTSRGGSRMHYVKIDDNGNLLHAVSNTFGRSYSEFTQAKRLATSNFNGDV